MAAQLISVLVPFRGNAERYWLWDRARRAIIETMGDLEHEIIHRDDGPDHDPVLFSRPKAINRAFLAATGGPQDVVVIWDADTIHVDSNETRAAILATQEDRMWRMPRTYYMLTEEVTRNLMRIERHGGGIGSAPDPPECEWVGQGVSWSGIVIVPQEAFWIADGFDERYIGWGADDVAFGLACETLYGPHVRYPDGAVHLWHPRGTQEQGNHEHSVAQRELTERYMAAAGDVAAMVAIVEEKPGLGWSASGVAGS